MTTIVTRAGKGSALTHNEVDANFTNLNNAKYESGNNATLGTIQGSTITATTAFSGNLTGNVTGDVSGNAGTVTNGVYTTGNQTIGGTKTFSSTILGNLTGDTSGAHNGTVGATTPAAGTFTNLAYTGTLTGGTGVINIGSGQVYKDASGNVGIGTSSPGAQLDQYLASGTTYRNIRNGSVATIEYASTAVSACAYGTQSNHPQVFLTNNTERMRIDSSGNVGIGTSSPGANKLAISGNVAGQPQVLQIAQQYSGLATDVQFYNFNNTTSDTLITKRTDGSLWLYQSGADYISVYTNSLERMRIDSSGNVLVGATSAGSYAAGSAIGTTGYISRSGTAGSFGNNRFNIFWNGSAARLWIDTVDQGSISVSSDYRIKTDVQAQTLTAIDRIAQLKPVTYTYADNETLNWKADGVAREGFIAHELQEIIPSAVDGEKDAENQIQSLKLDALCSVMVKAIQELSAKVTALEAQLNKE
jgi:hypothetical protein